MPAPLPSSHRIAMHPGPGGNTEWDRLGNGHLRTLSTGLSELGWEITAFDYAGALRGLKPADQAAVTHVHWTEQFALSVPQPRWVKALTTLQTRLATHAAPSRFLYAFAQRHVRHLAASRPLIYQAHDLESNWLQPARSHLLDRAFKLAFLREAHAWVVHEASCLPLLEQLSGRRAPVHAICPLGSYATFHGPAVAKAVARERLGFAPAEALFLLAGYSGPRRNPRDAATAFAAAQLPQARLAIASHNVTDYLTSSAPNLRLFAGLLPNDVVRDLYCAADWVLMAGQTYLTSAVVRTALSYGCPVICRRFGCQTDMARDAALWLDDATPGALTRAFRLAAAVGAPAHAEYGRAAAIRDAERPWPASVARYRDLLQSLA